MFLGSKTSNRTCDADCEEAAVVSSELSKPCAKFCAFSKSPCYLLFGGDHGLFYNLQTLQISSNPHLHPPAA